MTIYNPTGTVIIEAPRTRDAVIKFALMGDYYIELPFEWGTLINFPRGSYVIYKGRKFEIMSIVRPEFDSETGGYKYSLQFQAQQNHMKRFVCFWLGGPNPEAVFHNTTDLSSFGTLIIANMNKSLGTDNWQLGNVTIDNPETTKLVSFNGDKCWDALNTIAQTFEVEWWTEENGGIVSLNFGKLDIGTPETFKRGDVIKSIPAKKGDDSSYGTRFFVFGSTRNLTKEYGQAEQGGTINHISEIRLRLPSGQEYIDAIPNLPKQDIVEQVVFFDDIYPKNTETATSVETIDRTIVEGQIDKAYIMVCADTPFLPSNVIEGETLGAYFTSGSLNGREFELSINYNPATWKPQDGFDRKFEIKAQTESSGDSILIIPNENLKPVPGDTFVLTGVKLPPQRIEEAEQKLLEAGTSYAAKHSSDTDIYDCETNPVFCQHNDKNYEAGQAVLLVSPQFGKNGRLSRIQGYEKRLYNEYIATYTIGDNTPYSRLGSIESDVKASLYSQRIGITESDAAIYLIKRYDSTSATDSNSYSARRALWEFANKQVADNFKGKMTFNAGAQFGDYVPGLTGIGGLIDSNGQATLQNLTIRKFLEVPELRYNRVEVTMGDTWYAPCAGIIDVVDTQNQIITLKLEQGEIGSPRVGDICMGIFHSSISSENATSDYDDGHGNRRFAGFATCYFTVAEILDFGTGNYGRFRYELRPTSSNYPVQFAPAVSMTFVGYGSLTDSTRRSSRYETRTYQRYLTNVDNWEYTSDNIAAQFGDLTNLSIEGIEMSGYSAYLNNIYMSGVIRQFTTSGEEIQTINDRGLWTAGEIYNQNDDVFWQNARWRCLINDTKSEPTENSLAWELLERALEGAQGRQGCIYRVTEWTEGIEYHNDIHVTTTDIRYVDIVVRKILGTQYRFQCILTHLSSESNAPSIFTVEGRPTYWKLLNDMAPVYTPLLLAKNAVIDFIQGNSIRIMDDTGKVYAALMSGDYPLFIGGATVDNAPFYVSKEGKMVADNAEISGSITSTNGEIGGFKISNTSLTATSKIVGDAKVELSDSLVGFTSTHQGTKVYVGTDVLSEEFGSNVCPMFIENKNATNPLLSNVGAYFNVYGKIVDTSGIKGNHALLIARGDICGLRPHTRIVNSNVVLSTLDYTVIIGQEVTSPIELTLPANAEIGQTYEIYNSNRVSVHIKLSNGEQKTSSSKNYNMIKVIKIGSTNTLNDWWTVRFTPN